jgi:hypothetical protein
MTLREWVEELPKCHAARKEFESLLKLCAEWLLFGVNVMPGDAAGYEWLDGLRNRTCAAIAAGRGEGEK